MVLVGIQPSVLGLYLPPLLKNVEWTPIPPQMIISFPVQTAA
jgi:hypothetical protein